MYKLQLISNKKAPAGETGALYSASRRITRCNSNNAV